jgi:uncharacterized membrane protein
MFDLRLLDSVLALTHALAGAAWLGAMVYSFFVLHPGARAYFPKDADFEAFIATVSRGARYPVLAALALIGLSGAALVVVRWPPALSLTWLVLIVVKVLLYLGACGLFMYVSWRLWPARILALPAEVPQLQRLFRRVAAAMILIAGLAMALGILAHIW